MQVMRPACKVRSAAMPQSIGLRNARSPSARPTIAGVVCAAIAALTQLAVRPAYADVADADTAAVSFQVAAAACVILSADGQVLEVWSNTRDPSVTPAFRREQLNGPLVESTAETLPAYRATSWRIEWWRAPGLIYRASDDSPLDRLLKSAALAIINKLGS